MLAHRTRSIAFRIVVVAFLCVAVILPTAAAGTVTLIRQVFRDELVSRTKQALDTNERLLRSQLDHVRITLEAFARDPQLVRALAPDAGAEAVSLARVRLNGASGLIDSLENVALLGADCAVVLSDSDYATLDPRNFSQSGFCAAADNGAASYVSGRFVSVLSGRPVISLSVPVRGGADDRRIGVVSAVLDLAGIGVSLRDLQQTGQYTVVLDRNDRVLIDTRLAGALLEDSVATDPIMARTIEESSNWRGKSGVFDAEANGTSLVAAYDKYVDDPGSFTLVSVEPKSVSGSLERKILLILLGSGAGMVLVLVFALWITVRLSTRRLNSITGTIQDIAGGSEDERLPAAMSASDDEVGALARSFNRMIDRMHGSQELLAQSKAKSDAILLGIGDGVVAIDSFGKIILFNRAAERIADLVAADALGKPYHAVLRFVRGEEQTQEFSFINRALGGKMAVMPDGTSLVRPDGSLVPVADSSAPIMAPDGTVMGAVVVFRDVTHEREVDRIKTEFVSVASHQLRTPLTAIRWYLEDLQSEEIGPLLPEQKANVAQAVQSTNRMINLVNDMLNVSRLETGRLSLTPKPTDIAAVLRDVAQESAGIAAASGCAISLHLPEEPLPPISVDTVLVRQVAANLLSNAVKYSQPASGKPRVDVTLTKDGKQYYRVTVKDNGMGIGPVDKGRIFERFFRTNSAVRMQAEGSGLGLYIAKLIIEESGGMISFDSEEGEGSTFWFLLPIAGSVPRGGGKSLTTNGNKT